MFKINNTIIKFRKEYNLHPRTKVTTTIRTDYYDEYKKLLDSLNDDYCRGFDVLIEMLGENDQYLNDFVNRLKNINK